LQFSGAPVLLLVATFNIQPHTIHRLVPFAMFYSALIVCLIAADPAPQQLELLKIFRAEFVELTPGTGRFPSDFQMGCTVEGKGTAQVHKVTIRNPFSIAKYEVPQNLWEAVMGSNPSKWKGARNSVEMLTFEEAQEFCRRATDMMRAAQLIKDDEEIRLPSEAEWEYATRGGTTTRYSFGDGAKELGAYAWSTENAADNDPPVGAKKPNPWGLYDVHGYLWEWCLDSWHDDYSGAPADGSAWTDGHESQRRVARGGSWKDPASKLTSCYRHSFPKDTRDDALGLRCVLAKKKADRPK
jgi:formylglycine-generating enzyme required for sulfatase activity